MTHGKLFLFFGMLQIFTVIAAESVVWNADNKFENWQTFQNASGAVVDRNLVLTNIKFDCSITNHSVHIDPKKYNAFTFRYRAENIGTRGGEFYFAHLGESFSDSRSWKVPPLNADGQWHSATIYLTNLPSWENGGNIVRLRFDPTNSPGGRIEFSELKLEYLDTTATPSQNITQVKPASPAVSSAAEYTQWNKENKFAGWNVYYNLDHSLENGNWQLTITGPDCRVTNNSVRIDPEKFNAFSFRYRAENMDSRGGEFYFAHSGESFSDSRSWKIPPLNADGQWHTLTISPADLNSWKNGGIVTKLRFDPTNVPTGKIEISELKMEYLEKALSTLQTSDRSVIENDAPDWLQVKPEWQSSSQIGEHYFQGKMIRNALDLPRGEQHEFLLRRTFSLKEKPVYGFLQFTADDCAEGFVNGARIGYCNDWQRVFFADVTRFLQGGKNVLAFDYYNDNGAGGLLCELYVQYADGTYERINSDKLFRSLASTQSSGWKKMDFDDTGWESAVEQLPPPAAPWVTVLLYRYFENIRNVMKVEVSPKSVNAGDVVRFSLEGEGALPSRDIDFTIELRAKDTLLWSENLTLPKANVAAVGQNRWKAECIYNIPKYLNTNPVEVKFISDALSFSPEVLAGLNFNIVRLKTDLQFPAAPANIGENPMGVLTFMLNGKPFFPLWGQPTPSRRRDKKMRVNAAQLDLVTVNVDRTWVSNDLEINSFEFDRAAENAARENPAAYFMWDLTLYLPKEWAKKYPQELSYTESGKIANTSRTAFSFSSRQALLDMEQAMAKAIDYLENSPYANRIIGYRICSGETTEWLGWNSDEALDFSDCARQAFAQFAKQHYPELEYPTIPTMAERKQRDDGQLLWNPQKHLNTIAFFDFYSNSVADMLIDLTGKAKAQIGKNKLLGTYYGYTATLHWTGISQVRAHYALKKLLNAGYVDFIMSPNSYPLRELGDIVGDMKPFASMLNNKIIPVIEDDTRTHNGVNVKHSGGSGAQTITEAHSIAVLRRNMGVAACRGIPFYIYSLVSGTEWDFPAAVEDFRTFYKLCRHLEKHPGQRRAEIALVVSENAIKSMPMFNQQVESLLFLQQYRADGTVRKYPLAGPLLNRETFVGNQGRFCRSGAPVDILLAEDLKDHSGTYKLYVFLNSYQYDSAFLKAVDILKQRDCTLLWLYAPGYTTEMKNHVDNMYPLTGIKIAQFDKPAAAAVTLADNRVMGTPMASVAPLFFAADPQAEVIGRYSDGSAGIAAVRTGKAWSVFSGVWQLDMPFILDIARRSGVHLFAEGLDPLEANSSLVMMHTRFPGQKNVKLPHAASVVDVFNKKLIGINISEFTFEAKLHETRLFYFGKDAEGLLEKLVE